MFAKMLSLPFMCVVWIHLLFLVMADTEVEMTTPITNVAVGDILAIQCQVWNIQDGYTVMIVRAIDGGSEPITTGSKIMDSPIENQVFLSIRSFPDGSVVYFITILDVSQSDHGEYTCTVISGLRFVAHDTIVVNIRDYPDKTQPICTANPAELVITEGSMLELTCSTYRTVPVVTLKWRSRSSYQDQTSRNSSDGNSVFSTLIIRAQIAHQDAIFECEMTSHGFSDRKQVCQVGPIRVVKSKNSDTDASLITIGPGNNIGTTLLANGFITEDCSRNTCQSSSFTVLILTLTTLATGILTVVFLTTTIIMCCKYHSASAEVNRDRHEYIPCGASDPVYVSLQRRRENEQVYMTLEDPNNPDGRVLLPKEVFDQFYNRTLSLRKT